MLIVVYDACVFYPATVRDLLLTLSLTKLFQAKCTKVHSYPLYAIAKLFADIDPDIKDSILHLIGALDQN